MRRLAAKAASQSLATATPRRWGGVAPGRRPASRLAVVRSATPRAAEPAGPPPSPSQHPRDSGDRDRRYLAEFSMLSGRLAGVVQQAVEAATSGRGDREGGRAPAREVAAAAQPRGEAGAAAVVTAAAGGAAPGPSPAGLASALLRCLEGQLQARKYMSAGDEAGDVLGAFQSATLLYYPGGGLQAVLEEAAAAAAEARGPAGPAAVAALRSLGGAVGRLAAAPNAEAARGKAAAVVTCLLGMAEALEGATLSGSGSGSGSASGSGAAESAGSAESAAEAPAGAPAGGAGAEAGAEAVEAGLLREAATVLDCIAGGPGPLPASHTSPAGHTVSASAPSHPLLAALETRLYGESTWRPDSASEIAAGLVDFLAGQMAPGHGGSVLFLTPHERPSLQISFGSAGARGAGAASACLHGMARAQAALARALREHGADPAAASRLLAALAQALAAAAITRHAAPSPPASAPPHHPRQPHSGPSAGVEPLFGEAQLLLGLSSMAAGEAMGQAQAPGGDAVVRAAIAAAMSADAAAGDASLDLEVAVSDASLVVEVLAAEAGRVAAGHAGSIQQVLQGLREVPRSLEGLLGLSPSPHAPTPGHAPATAPGGAGGPVLQRPTAAAVAEDVLRRAAAGHGAAAAADAAASVAASNVEGLAPPAGSGAGGGAGGAAGGAAAAAGAGVEGVKDERGGAGARPGA